MRKGNSTSSSSQPVSPEEPVSLPCSPHHGSHPTTSLWSQKDPSLAAARRLLACTILISHKLPWGFLRNGALWALKYVQMLEVNPILLIWGILSCHITPGTLLLNPVHRSLTSLPVTLSGTTWTEINRGGVPACLGSPLGLTYTCLCPFWVTSGCCIA